jgi:CRP/FNR family transcriptional regulator, cyclic AMP receptor protein
MASGYDEAVYLMYLSQVPMFSTCTPQDLEEVAALATPKHVDLGDVIVHEGDAGDEFYVLASGSALVRRGGNVIASLEPGAFFGELALFDPSPRNATVTATAPTTLVVLKRDAFRKVLGDSTAIRDALLRGMARRLHDLDGKA